MGVCFERDLEISQNKYLKHFVPPQVKCFALLESQCFVILEFHLLLLFIKVCFICVIFCDGPSYIM